MSEMIKDPYATRGETLSRILRPLPCLILGHSPTQRWSHCIDCRRCFRTLAYGPEITDEWPDSMKAAWRAGKKALEAYAEENWARNASRIEARQGQDAQRLDRNEESLIGEAETPNPDD